MANKSPCTFHTRSHVGKIRRMNQDYLSTCDKRNFSIIADGIGGHKHGEVASRVAVDACVKHLCDAEDELIKQPSDELAKAIKFANEQVLIEQTKEVDYSKMGTTLCCMHLQEESLSYAWIGDSRIYRIQANQNNIEMLSQDHTLDQSKIDKDENPALFDRASSILTRFVGSSMSFEPEVGQVDTEKGDIFLCCTDGLSDLVPDELILEYAQQFANDLDGFADKLVDRALDCGGHDNISFVFTKIS